MCDRVWRLADAPPRRVLDHRRRPDRLARRAASASSAARRARLRSQRERPEARAHARARRHLSFAARLEALAELAPDVVIECTGAPRRHRGGAVRRSRRTASSASPASARSHRGDFNMGLFNRNMVLNNGTVFGTVNANRRHYALAADALARADREWLVAPDHAPRAARALRRGLRASQGRHQGRHRVHAGMIPKSGHRFSEKIMPRNN